ncbi:hypothetical protein A6K24_01240 [Metabacillus litoralis]|uniref:Uncharacterized protein n=1 Tax=Metabacillus litoralis TaxID=152268 RepID=A0A179T9X7_9BACI|nr:hypothetical protein A6K24_01240 [Metabacillus litoralis]
MFSFLPPFGIYSGFVSKIQRLLSGSLSFFRGTFSFWNFIPISQFSYKKIAVNRKILKFLNP